MRRLTCTVLGWLYEHSNNLVAGMFTAIFGYFAESWSVIAIATVAILLDCLFGVLRALKEGLEKGEKKFWKIIESRKLWRTVEKLLYVVIILMFFISVDKELNQVQLHKTIAWLIVGFEGWSILENMAAMVNHPIFRAIKELMGKKVKDTTGIDLNEKGN